MVPGTGRLQVNQLNSFSQQSNRPIIPRQQPILSVGDLIQGVRPTIMVNVPVVNQTVPVASGQIPSLQQMVQIQEEAKNNFDRTVTDQTVTEHDDTFGDYVADVIDEIYDPVSVIPSQVLPPSTNAGIGAIGRPIPTMAQSLAKPLYEFTKMYDDELIEKKYKVKLSELKEEDVRYYRFRFREIDGVAQTHYEEIGIARKRLLPPLMIAMELDATASQRQKFGSVVDSLLKVRYIKDLLKPYKLKNEGLRIICEHDLTDMRLVQQLQPVQIANRDDQFISLNNNNIFVSAVARWRGVFHGSMASKAQQMKKFLDSIRIYTSSMRKKYVDTVLGYNPRLVLQCYTKFTGQPMWEPVHQVATTLSDIFMYSVYPHGMKFLDDLLEDNCVYLYNKIVGQKLSGQYIFAIQYRAGVGNPDSQSLNGESRLPIYCLEQIWTANGLDRADLVYTYWQSQPATVAGMVNNANRRESAADLPQAIQTYLANGTIGGGSRTRPNQLDVQVILDIGSGIGRKVRQLQKIFEEANVELLEPRMDLLVESIAKNIVENPSHIFYCQDVQSFWPRTRYDFVIVQWVTVYMTDMEIIKFLRKMAVLGLTKKGVIMFRDNVTEEHVDINIEEGALVRPIGYLKPLIESSGYEIVHDNTTASYTGLLSLQTLVAKPIFKQRFDVFGGQDDDMITIDSETHQFIIT